MFFSSQALIQINVSLKVKVPLGFAKGFIRSAVYCLFNKLLVASLPTYMAIFRPQLEASTDMGGGGVLACSAVVVSDETIPEKED